MEETLRLDLCVKGQCSDHLSRKLRYFQIDLDINSEELDTRNQVPLTNK